MLEVNLGIAALKVRDLFDVKEWVERYV